MSVGIRKSAILLAILFSAEAVMSACSSDNNMQNGSASKGSSIENMGGGTEAMTAGLKPYKLK